MKDKRKSASIYLWVMLITTAVATALRTAACYLEMDYETGHFNDHVLISVAGAIMVGATVLYLSYPVSVGRGTPLCGRFSNPATYVPAGGVGAALLFFAAYFGETATQLFGADMSLAAILRYPAPLWALVLSVLAIGSVLYFALNGLIAESGNGARGWLGMVTTLLLATYAVYLYFDTTLAINAPSKVTDEMAYLFASLFFLYETRISIGRGKWRSYVTFGLIAASVLAYSSIPALTVYFAKGETISNNIYESVLSLMLFIFITARLAMVKSLSEDKPCEVATAIDAKIAEEEARRAEEMALARDNNIKVENEPDEDGDVGENYAISLDDDKKEGDDR